MSKKNIFIVTLFALIFTASFVTADYVGPASSPPNGNTPPVLKTESENPNNKDFLYEKIGTGNGNLYPALSQLANGSYFGVTENGQAYGLFSDKSVVVGNTIISDDFTVSSRNTSDPFDQYTNQFSYLSFPTNTSTTAKKIEALINGVLFSKVSVANDVGASNSYSLELSTLNNTPTTNIGLGNTCSLYPQDIGTKIMDDLGCPAGSYMSMYQTPSFSGAISSTNNTNNQVVAQCTYFRPVNNPIMFDCHQSETEFFVGSRFLLAYGGRLNPTGQKGKAFLVRGGQTSPGSCVFEAKVSTLQFKNPKIHGIVYKYDPVGASWNIIAQSGPTQTSTMSIPYSCNTVDQYKREWVITDDYGQWYSPTLDNGNGVPNWDSDPYWSNSF